LSPFSLPPFAGPDKQQQLLRKSAKPEMGGNMHYTHEGSTEEENMSSLNERSSDQLGNRAVGGGRGRLYSALIAPLFRKKSPYFLNL
jgi:hypothetical protein